MEEHESEAATYALETTCNNMTLLLPLTGIEIILPREELTLSKTDTSMASYQDQYFSCYSCSTLLGCSTHCEEPYAILIQSDTMKIFLYVQHIENVKLLKEPSYKLPTYFQDRFTYITKCYALQQTNLAYLIDLDKLLEVYHQRNEETHL